MHNNETVHVSNQPVTLFIKCTDQTLNVYVITSQPDLKLK